MIGAFNSDVSSGIDTVAPSFHRNVGLLLMKSTVRLNDGATVKKLKIELRAAMLAGFAVHRFFAIIAQR